MNDRLIILDGAVNFRDLGGYVAANGRSVCWQKIYRSDRLDNLTMQDMEILAQKHIVTDCDLRTSYEQSYWQDRLWAVSYTHLTLPTIALLCRSRWSPYH